MHRWIHPPCIHQLAGNGPTGRSLSIVFRCSDDVKDTFEPDREFVNEYEDGHYKVELETVYGCPLECPLDSEKALCSGNGACHYDKKASRSYCCCNLGYTGNDCGKIYRKGNTAGLTAGLVIVCMLLIGLLVFVIYVWRKGGLDLVSPSHSYQSAHSSMDTLAGGRWSR